MDILRLKDRLNHAQCSSDGMRIDAWKVAVQGIKENYLLPAKDIYGVYYARSEIGKNTKINCNIFFVDPHSFYLGQLYDGGILWFILLLVVLLRTVKMYYKTMLGIGFVGYLVFLAVSPTYFVFQIILLLWIVMLYTGQVDINSN